MRLAYPRGQRTIWAGGTGIVSDLLSGARIEYIIRARPFVGSRCRRGCRTLVPFNGAVFDFALPLTFSCATVCSASMDAAISTSSPSAVIAADPSSARPAPATIGRDVARGTALLDQAVRVLPF